MTLTETVLREILEQRTIGAAKIGGSFSEMAHRYGDPTATVDPKEYGFDERCKIWNYDEVQVWSDVCDTIDRVFFKANSEQTQCTNQNFVCDMAAIRDKLKGCDVEVFERALRDESAKTRRRASSTELSVTRDDIEVFATFVASGVDGPHQLSTLRLNGVADSKGSDARSVTPCEK